MLCEERTRIELARGGDVRKKEKEVGENENRWDENKSVWEKCETEIEVF